MRSRWFVYLFLGMFVACTGKPMYVLSDKKMENVLFDLHLAEIGVSENARIFYNDSAKKQDLLQSVFEKHKISQERFDTSLVWYNAHLSHYLKINTKVTERYDRWISQLQAEVSRMERLDKELPRFEDLELEDFMETWFSPWLMQVLTDSILSTDSISILPTDSVLPTGSVLPISFVLLTDSILPADSIRRDTIAIPLKKPDAIPSGKPGRIMPLKITPVEVEEERLAH